LVDEKVVQFETNQFNFFANLLKTKNSTPHAILANTQLPAKLNRRRIDKNKEQNKPKNK